MPVVQAASRGPFHLPDNLFSFLPVRMGGALRAAAERLLGLTHLNRIYDGAIRRPLARNFCERALDELNAAMDVSTEGLARIPASGPLIVVCNHPFGGLDGLMLTALLRRVRPDVRLLANYLLRCIPEMHENCIFVDPFGGPAAAAANRASMKSAIEWVKQGGALAAFPAGEVSHLTIRRGAISDPPWSETIARLARRTGAAVLPVFFDGANSRMFQIAGLLHPRLRTVLLPRELVGHRGREVHIEIGSLILPARLAKAGSAAEVTEYLRLRTYILRGRVAVGAKPSNRKTTAPPPVTPVIGSVSSTALAAEIAALPSDQCLASSGTLSVYFGDAAQIPNVMREIGRLREATFRLVGEGTGREIDLDRFDPHYLHLLVWNAQSKAVLGAYRMGPTDVLLDKFGVDGLYTNTLFRFGPGLLAQLNPALELGRSFVIPECQRDFAPLMLLWKGIGRYVARFPRYRILFGAVSISDDYASMTQQFLMAFLKTHRFDHDLAAAVAPRNPPAPPRFRDAGERPPATLVNDVAEMEELVTEIEANRRGMPVLLRQYLRLNARLLGFNVDPDFGDVLDGLVLIDLAAVDRPILDRYLGREGAARFLARHARR